MDHKPDELPSDGDGYKKALEGYAGIFRAVRTAYYELDEPEDWEHKLPRLTIRYRLQRAYRQLLPDHPGQRYHVLRGHTEQSDVMEASFWFEGTDELDVRSLIRECVSIL
jgi:hypothetical protein